MLTSFDHINSKEILPGFNARFIHSSNQTISLVHIKKGSILPEHHHPHTQISQVLEGKFELTISGKTKLCETGDIALIDSNEKHSGVAITDCKILDIFNPVREDYL